MLIAIWAAAAVVSSCTARHPLASATQPTGSPTPTSTPIPLPTRPGPCPSSLQAAIDSASSGATINVVGCVYSGGITIAKPLTLEGAAIASGAGGTAVTVASSDVTLLGLRITGPQSTAYHEGEFGIAVTATAAVPVERLTIRDSEIGSFGKAAMWLQFVTDIAIEDNDVHDAVYGGIMVLSGTRGAITGNTVSRIGVTGAGTHGNNAYGIALVDQGGPPTTDFVVDGNTVTDVPTWHAIDSHGGLRLQFTNNTIERSMRGIFLTVDAAGNRPTTIAVTGNVFGSPAPITTNLAAVTTYDAIDVTITGNVATGWGESGFFQDYEGLSTGLVVAGNAATP